MLSQPREVDRRVAVRIKRHRFGQVDRDALAPRKALDRSRRHTLELVVRPTQLAADRRVRRQAIWRSVQLRGEHDRKLLQCLLQRPRV